MRALAFLLAAAAAFGQAVDQVHLAWVEDAATTITVVWREKHPAASPVTEYRAAKSGAWQKAAGRIRPSGTSGALYEATLRGLQPDTEYEYRIGGVVHRTRTAPAKLGALDVVYVADTGMIGREDGLTTGTRQVIDEIAKLKPRLVLLGGDYAYYNTDKRWGSLDQTIDAWFNQMLPVAVQAPMMPSYGNHEIFLKEGYMFWADRFPTPEGYDNRRNYSFDVAGVHFVSVLAADSERGALPQTSLDWIDRDLTAARKNGSRWIVPFLHVAPFSDGTNHPSNLELRAQLGPLFEKHGIHVAVTSHDQSYERTYPLRGVPHDIKASSTDKGCYGVGDGTTYLKVSPGGKMSNINGKFAQFKTNPPPFYTAFRDNTMHHYARLRFTADDLRVEVFGVSGDGRSPVVQDRFRYTYGTCDKE